MSERMNYTVTPGPALLARMGTTWTLFDDNGNAQATFSQGEGAPGPVTLSLSPERAAQLQRDDYEVVQEGAGTPNGDTPAADVPLPEPAIGVQPLAAPPEDDAHADQPKPAAEPERRRRG